MSRSTRGRPKGAPNQVTNEAKQAVLAAFEMIGGARRLAKWIQKHPANESAYWIKIFAKLLPRPAIEAAPAPEALPPVTGALVWKTPEWVKQLQSKGLLQAGVAGAAAAAAPGAGAAEHPPDEGEPPYRGGK